MQPHETHAAHDLHATTADAATLRDSRHWLWLGVAALAVAGVFAVILVAARAPQLAMFTHLFSMALVIHVDLSVLIWFLAVAGMGWAQLVPQPCYAPWQKAALWTVAAATFMMVISPIDPHWVVIKSNYIPVMYNLPFVFGLGLLAAGLSVATLPVIWHYRSAAARRSLTLSLQGFMVAACTTLMALLAFFLAAYSLPPDLGVEVMFETLFWAGGHILQVTYTLLMMAGWLALVEIISGAAIHRRVVQAAYGFSLLTALAHLAGFALHPFDSPEFIGYHTQVMIMLGGVGVSILMLAIIVRLWSARGRIVRPMRAYASSLVCSLIVFTAGGVLGLMITGQNVTIPAHYHGSIVGVTLALMGLAYAMLPRFGYASVADQRLAFWQPIFYMVGQLMHVGGLAYSGGYGVLRKTPAGVSQHLAPDVKAALGFMGLGGLLAIIGGLLFVVVMARAFTRRV